MADAIEGVGRAMEYGGSVHEVTNLDNNTPVPLIDVVRSLEEALGVKARVYFLPAKPGDVPAAQGSIEKAVRLLGFGPRTPFRRGLCEVVRWLRGATQR